MLAKLLTSEHYLDFHTHQLRRQDQTDIVEIVSLHLGKSTEHQLFTIGKHPWWTEHPLSAEEQLLLHGYLKQPNCLAMGEIGLDKFKGPEMSVQIEILRSQLKLAAELQMPVVIHCVRAFYQLLELKKDYPQIRNCCIHGYARHATLAAELIKKGFYLSLMPVLEPTPKYIQLLQSLPLNKFFLETDSMPNILIEDVYLQAAEILGLSIPQLKKQMIQNAITFFENG